MLVRAIQCENDGTREEKCRNCQRIHGNQVKISLRFSFRILHKLNISNDEKHVLNYIYAIITEL